MIVLMTCSHRIVRKNGDASDMICFDLTWHVSVRPFFSTHQLRFYVLCWSLYDMWGAEGFIIFIIFPLFFSFFCLKDFLWLGCRGGCIIFLPWQTGAALTLLMNTEQTLSALQKVYKCFFHSHLCLCVAFSNLLQFCSERWPCINFALLHYNQALLGKGSL